VKGRTNLKRQAGFLMLEALVALVLVLVGLLGLVALQARAQQAETESYQRVQALILVRDMADRINANRSAAASYAVGAPVSAPMGNGSTKDCSAPTNVVDIDLCQWQNALLGAAETVGGTCTTASGANCVGAMIGARGCITPMAGPNQYLVQVVWQGLVQTSNPPASVACGANLYGDEAASATLGRRRAVTTVVEIGTLSP